MGRTFTDFSQLSKGMFRKGEPVVAKKDDGDCPRGSSVPAAVLLLYVNGKCRFAICSTMGVFDIKSGKREEY